MKQKYLIPVGKECLLATRSEAEYAFARQGFFGDVSLIFARLRTTRPRPPHYIGPPWPEQMIVVCWNCADSRMGNVILPAFDYQEDLLSYEQANLAMTILPGGLMVFNKMGYMLCQEPSSENKKHKNELVIRQIFCYPDEGSIMRLTGLFGLKPERAVLHKLNSLRDGEINFAQKKCEDYISVAWKVYCGQKNFWYAAFAEDEILFELYEFNTINWTAVGEGKGFIRDKIYYSVGYSDEYGYFFTEGILRPERRKGKIIHLTEKGPF